MTFTPLGDLYASIAKARRESGADTSDGGITIIGDKAAYLSPLDRTVVEGRAAHREHMKKHGVMEAGDMKIGEYANRERSPTGSIRSDIQRAMERNR